jgi:hypothetical protein
LDDPWHRDINISSEVLLAIAMGDSVHLSGVEGDSAMTVDEDSMSVEDAGEWPELEFS